MVPILIDKNPLPFVGLGLFELLSQCQVLYLVDFQSMLGMIFCSPGKSLVLICFPADNGLGFSLITLLMLIWGILNGVSQVDPLSLFLILVFGSIFSFYYKQSPIGGAQLSSVCSNLLMSSHICTLV